MQGKTKEQSNPHPRRDADEEALQAAVAESLAERDLMGEILQMEEDARLVRD